MERIKVLVVNLLEGAGLVDSVQQILACPGQQWGEFIQKSLSVGDNTTESVDLTEAVAGSSAQLLLLITSSDMISQAANLIRQLSKGQPNLPIIVVGNEISQAGMMELLNMGAADYVATPLRAIDLLPRIWKLARRWTEEEQVAWKLMHKLGLELIVSKSEGFLAEARKIPVIAKCDAGVFIIGETGTGKELFARAVHYLSPRSDHPFVAVNCGAIPSDLIENELFGHIRGAYTGANATQQGLISEADGGTLFLDDVNSLPMQAQAKFLRFLQEKEYRMLGSAKIMRADVRVVAASNVDPEDAAKHGTLRRDLLYRLNVVPLNLPPLRNRKIDIPLLAQHFLEKYAYEFRKALNSFSPEAISRLMAYDWPGNVRELENVVERTVVFAAGPVVEVGQIILPSTASSLFLTHLGSFKEEKARLIGQFEKNYLEDLLHQHGGNITKAAKAARKNRRAFWELIRKYNVDVGGLPGGPPRTGPGQSSLKAGYFYPVSHSVK